TKPVTVDAVRAVTTAVAEAVSSALPEIAAAETVGVPVQPAEAILADHEPSAAVVAVPRQTFAPLCRPEAP
ncbi:hypothetical protein, partial [Clostridium perfringens]